MRETTRRRMWISMRLCIVRSFRFERKPRLLRDASARHFVLPLAFSIFPPAFPLQPPFCRCLAIFPSFLAFLFVRFFCLANSRWNDKRRETWMHVIFHRNIHFLLLILCFFMPLASVVYFCFRLVRSFVFLCLLTRSRKNRFLFLFR